MSHLPFLSPQKPSENSKTMCCLTNFLFDSPDTGPHRTQRQWPGDAAVSRVSFVPFPNNSITVHLFSQDYFPTPLLFKVSSHSCRPWLSHLQIKTAPSVPLDRTQSLLIMHSSFFPWVSIASILWILTILSFFLHSTEI